MRTFLYTLFVVGVFVISVGSAQAQLLGSLATVEISLSPEHPQPGQTVTATASSPSEDIRSASIVWLLNNEIQDQGVGGAEFTFTAGAIGETQTLGVLVQTPNNYTLAQTVTLQPSEVTLLWEGDTYTPPFYKGRSLYSSGSLVRAEAVPHFTTPDGGRYSSSELIYTWSKNGTVLGSISGKGASSIITDGPPFFGDYILAVEVSTPEGTQIARSAALVETTEPVLTLYEKDPLIGLTYHSSIKARHVFSGASQLQVQAVPYFMDALNANDGYLNYSWLVNGTEVSGQDTAPSLLTIKLSNEKDIATRIRVVADHTQHLLQTGTYESSATFEGSVRNSLFGL